MRNTLILLLFLCAFGCIKQASAQNNAVHITRAQTTHDHTPGRTCHAHTVLQQQMQADPAMERRMRDMEEKTQQYVREHAFSTARSSRVIPVYVHVIYRTSQENISLAQIQSQIDQINADFAATNSDYNPPSDFASVASGNTGIQFVLENVTRTQTSRSTWGTNDLMKSAANGGVNPITPNTHLNMWVCNIGGGILGYAQFPGGSSSTDGVVMSPQYFGSINYGSNPGSYYLSAPFNRGRTTTHEIGHYLNLRHIWGDGNCSVDDFVGDTPTAGNPNYGCPSNNTNSCSGGQRDMFMNYMDYVDDNCMFMFTKGQDARMQACLAGPRSQLGTTSGGGNNGGGSNNCYGTVALSITTDRYGSETTWTITNSSGTTVASGGGYGNNQTYNPTLTLPAGNYTFTINDSYGDGICCQFGSGSFTLSGDGQTIASGGAFGSSTSASFCVAAQSNCFSNVTLALTTDQYASETTWTVTDRNTGATAASGSNYANNRSYNININVPAGDYTFTIRDSYGDGICCQYGNGSFTLRGDGQTILSGGAFGASDGEDFCVGSSARSVEEPVEAAAQALTEVRLYPNPAQDLIHAELFHNEQPLMGRILDATGRTLWMGELEAGQNDINISSLAPGLYYLAVVQTNGQTMTKKFVKQ